MVRAGLALAFLVAVLAAGVLISRRLGILRRKVHPWLIRNATLLGAYRSILAMIGFPLVVIGGIYTYQQLMQRLAVPEVALTFADPSGANVSVWNTSSTVVRDPKYQVVLFNIDDAQDAGNPLPIPVFLGDYIRPRERLGPNQMMGQAAVSSRVKKGDRIVGWATVICPECPGASYWVFIKQGVEGWYAKIPDGTFPDAARIAALIKQPQELLEAFMAAVPAPARREMERDANSAANVPEELREYRRSGSDG